MLMVPQQREYTPRPLPEDEYTRLVDLSLTHTEWAIRYTEDPVGRTVFTAEHQERAPR